jgi:HicA toxin of bacterial toxin-antitoxin,
MNSRHRKTLATVFAEPTKSNIPWTDIEALLLAIGCKSIEGSGSRVRFVFENKSIAAHRPHPRKEAKEYVVRALRDYLNTIGIKP